MDSEDIDAVMIILQTISGCKLLYNDYSGDEYYAVGISPAQIKFSGPIHFINCIFVPSDVAAEVIEKLSIVENLAITMAVSQKVNHKDILITNKLATKEHAVTILLRLISVESKDAIGVGDGYNDIELFRAVGRKVPMGNAVSELKEAADEVIGDITQDGFAEFLEEINR
jgi:hydroxymethylpyrimidine pyrophosphatase-like HAD family hydrolase